MRPRSKPIDKSGSPDELVRFHLRDWARSEDLLIPAHFDGSDWEWVSCRGVRRWMDARAAWSERNGLGRGAGYALLEAERRRRFPVVPGGRWHGGGDDLAAIEALRVEALA